MKYLKLVSDEGGEIAKRLFITNGVDSLISTIGVVSGTYVTTKQADPRLYLGASLGGAVALGFLSGFLGVYLTERVERMKELEEMEKEVMGNLSKSLYAKATNYVALYVALWSALGSLGLPMIALLPFFVAFFVKINAVFISLAIMYLELFTLGLYAGRSLRTALSYLLLGLGATALASALGDLLIRG